MQRKGIHLPLPGRYARIILHIEMPLILLAAVIFLIAYLMAREVDPVYANMYYPPLVVYLLYPIMMTVFSILLVERLEKI